MKLNRVEKALMNNPARERLRIHVGDAVVERVFGDFVIGVGRATPAASPLQAHHTAEVYV